VEKREEGTENKRGREKSTYVSGSSLENRLESLNRIPSTRRLRVNDSVSSVLKVSAVDLRSLSRSAQLTTSKDRR
jgi:hypothetical protein